jgi:hypothetical protein
MRIIRPSFEHAFAAALDEAAREEAETTRVAHLADADAALMQALEALIETREDDASPASPWAQYREELAANDRAAAADSGAPPPVEPKPSPPLRTGSAHDLSRERRRLALANHPDRVPEEQREAASRAMAEINAAIDQALKRLRKGGPR